MADTDVADMPTVETLDQLTKLVRRHCGLFVRWSRGPAADAAGASSDYSHLKHDKGPDVRPWVTSVGSAPAPVAG